MFNLDGSETSWLIYADWLEDNDKDNSLVKFGLSELIVNQWNYEFRICSVGSEGNIRCTGGNGVGIDMDIGLGNPGVDDMSVMDHCIHTSYNKVGGGDGTHSFGGSN